MNYQKLTNIFKSSLIVDRNVLRKAIHPKTYKTSATHSSLAVQPTEVTDETPKFVNPLRYSDYFEVNNLFTIKDLFDARVHFGHKLGSLNDKMRPYIFGSRFDHVIFDLEQTATHLRKALNFTAHIAYRGGIILFVSNYHQHCPLIEQTAFDCKEYAHTRTWKRGTFVNSSTLFEGTIRLPDLCIVLNTLNDVFNQHLVVLEAAKSNIPTIAILDSNCDPTIVTYPIPGNDDTPCAIELYLSLFKQAILKGKEVRNREMDDGDKAKV